MNKKRNPISVALIIECYDMKKYVLKIICRIFSIMKLYCGFFTIKI